MIKDNQVYLAVTDMFASYNFAEKTIKLLSSESRERLRFNLMLNKNSLDTLFRMHYNIVVSIEE